MNEENPLGQDAEGANNAAPPIAEEVPGGNQSESPFASWIDSAIKVVEDNWLNVAVAVLALFATIILASWARRIASAACRKANLEETLARFFGKLARWAVLLVGLLFVLDMFGVETSSFAVIIGAAGLAIGLALQGTLGHFASGVMLLIFRPFKVGDVINAGGVVGKVFEIDLFTTALDTADNRRIIVPNGSIFGGTIENITFHDTRRVEVSVGTDYGADLDKVRDVLEKAVLAVPTRLEDRAHQIFLASLGDSSIDWKIRLWCKTPDFWACMEQTTRLVKMELDAAGIGIPFPQMDIHLDKLEG
ncbi:MAG: mechanosensitive ion channel family protein [Planctomycetota bacterium]